MNSGESVYYSNRAKTLMKMGKLKKVFSRFLCFYCKAKNDCVEAIELN